MTGVGERRGALTRMMLGSIAVYQGVPRRREGSCRFVPTCSAYAAAAIEGHGPRRGVWLAIRRVLRCRPFGAWGYDPVPGLEGLTDRPPVSETPLSERAA